MIGIDFYKEAADILAETKKERTEHFKKLNENICEIYGVDGEGIFNIKSIKDGKGIQADIGSFNSFSKEMILESTYIEKPN